jgi:hypothetical protein
MIVTVLWEDQRGGDVLGFGPHELLIACLADDLDLHRWELSQRVQSQPRKGNSNVRKALQKDIAKLSRGKVLAVLDRDKVRELWKTPGPMPADCMKGITERFRGDAPGDYELLFLVQNVESLLDGARTALCEPPLDGKPTPDRRDRLLHRCAGASVATRRQVRERCPSFDRLVTRVAEALKAEG